MVSKKMAKPNLGPSESDTAVAEAKLLKSLSHDNIVKYVDAFADDQSIILVMENCESGIIRRRLNWRDQGESGSKKTLFRA